MSWNKKFYTGTVICPRAVVLARGRMLRANTTEREHIINLKDMRLKE